MQPGSAPRMPPGAVRDGPQRCAWGPALCAMAPSAALGTLIMAVTWDCVRRARLMSVSGSGIRQQSGLDAAKPTAVLKVSQQGMHVAARR